MTKPLAALLLVCSLLMGGCVGSIWKKMHVKIENNLPGEPLSPSTQSKDDDLGTQHLIVKGCWEFSFGPCFLGTRFFCGFSWPGRFEWFDIYLQVRDEFVCDKCTWKISLDGPCRIGKKDRQKV
ncbi:LOW QUALITY PROTEIN: hypothetical protein BT93_L1685 [Corymbia citriodora subsp. variegata]|uniref:S-protein homolog n=1 Tax=Corymbia citriodora subsp. variegata TaxID=360336 RepID=A0A8T0CZ99_CORYI|nr:LOW QUALITY PROTEIN: hypothetical protein BT93_L1685 [Corymbia citriodora subsp. variegata]